MGKSSIDAGRAAPNMLAVKLGRFTPLSGDEQQTVDRLITGRLRRFEAREDIILEGETPSHVNLIVSGWACRYKLLSDGRRQVLAFFLPGDLCEFRTDIFQHTDHSLSALTAVTVAEIPNEAMIELTEGGSQLARAFWWSFLVAGAIEREWIVNLGQRTATERIGHLFCEIFLRQGMIGGTGGGSSCDMPLTQMDLAEACGLSNVHVNRTLQDLRMQGLIDLRGKRLTIPDFDRLACQSMFSPNYLHLGRTGGPPGFGGA